MLYPFEAEDGEQIEIFYPSMDEAPKIGSTVEKDGKVFKRVFSAGKGSQVVHDYKWEPYASRSLGRWQRGCKKFTKDGKPIFETRKQEIEFAAREGYVRD